MSECLRAGRGVQAARAGVRLRSAPGTRRALAPSALLALSSAAAVSPLQGPPACDAPSFVHAAAVYIPKTVCPCA